MELSFKKHKKHKTMKMRNFISSIADIKKILAGFWSLLRHKLR